MLSDYIQKVKDWSAGNKRDIYLAFLIFLAGFGGFGLGRLSALGIPKEPISITNSSGDILEATTLPATDIQNPQTTPNKAENYPGKYIASKSGTAYHYPWCPGALKIKEENKVWFQTLEDAEKAGYKPAGNCPGL